MILVAYRHGLRASELCGLRIADLDLESGSPDIRRLKGSLHRVQPLCRHKRTRDQNAAGEATLTDEDAFGELSLIEANQPNCLF